jgi:hypothetical protein
MAAAAACMKVWKRERTRLRTRFFTDLEFFLCMAAAAATILYVYEYL